MIYFVERQHTIHFAVFKFLPERLCMYVATIHSFIYLMIVDHIHYLIYSEFEISGKIVKIEEIHK